MKRSPLPIIELDLLKTLVAIHETGSFSAAANHVGRTQSAISMQVKKLEDLLGRELFNRDARKVSLTPVGDKVLVHARKMLAENQNMVRQFFTPDLEGEFRVGVFQDIAKRYLAKMLRSFHEQWPGITLLTTVDESVRLSSMIQSNELDVALVACDTASNYLGMPVDPLHTEKIVWAGLKGGCAASKRPLPIASWDGRCIIDQLATAALERAGIEYKKVVITTSFLAQNQSILTDLVVVPFGISSLSDGVVDVGDAFGLPPIGEYCWGFIKSANASEAHVDDLINFMRSELFTTWYYPPVRVRKRTKPSPDQDPIDGLPSTGSGLRPSTGKGLRPSTSSGSIVG